MSRPTVSIALKTLEQEGYVWMNEGHFVYLTEPGLKIAREAYERNQFFQDLRLDLRVDRETAVRDTCELEHSASFSAIRFVLERKKD